MLAARAPSLDLHQRPGQNPRSEGRNSGFPPVFPLRTAEAFMQGSVKRGARGARKRPGLEHSIYRRITARHLTYQTGRGREWLPEEYHGAVGNSR